MTSTIHDLIEDIEREAVLITHENARLNELVSDQAATISELKTQLSYLETRNKELENKVVEVLEKNSGLEFLMSELQKKITCVSSISRKKSRFFGSFF